MSRRQREMERIPWWRVMSGLTTMLIIFDMLLAIAPML
jgi:hypothetical protein